jgi:phosphohistidine swiveling domain-containing protein
MENVMATVVQTAVLRVQGSYITDLVRQNLLENGFREALRIVQSEWPQMSTDQVIQILKGEKCFINDPKGGAGDLLLVDDNDSEDWKEELHEAYKGICKIGGGFYEPYAYVVNYGPEDMTRDISDYPTNDPVEAEYIRKTSFVTERMQHHFDEHPGAFPKAKPELLVKRAMHYADFETDKAVRCLIPRDEGRMTPLLVLFSEAAEPPVWMELQTPQQAVDAMLGEIRAFGYEDTYGSYDLETEEDEQRMTSQAKLNFADLGLVFSRRDDSINQKLDEFLRSAKESEPHHYEDRREKIIAQNAERGYGFRAVDFGPGIGLRDVPNGPLVKWALNRGMGMKNAGPEWTPVSISGLKQAGDDPVHTDWITGAGLENYDFGIEPLKSIQNDLAQRIQEETVGFKMHVLVAGKDYASGTVKHCRKDTPVDGNTIAVVANASIHFDRIAREAAAVIVLEGGALSHLAVNGLEMGQLIIRDPEAREKYPEGTVLSIDLSAGRVMKLQSPEEENDTSPAFGL